MVFFSYYFSLFNAHADRYVPIKNVILIHSLSLTRSSYIFNNCDILSIGRPFMYRTVLEYLVNQTCTKGSPVQELCCTVPNQPVEQNEVKLNQSGKTCIFFKMKCKQMQKNNTYHFSIYKCRRMDRTESLYCTALHCKLEE